MTTRPEEFEVLDNGCRVALDAVSIMPPKVPEAEGGLATRWSWTELGDNVGFHIQDPKAEVQCKD